MARSDSGYSQPAVGASGRDRPGFPLCGKPGLSLVLVVLLSPAPSFAFFNDNFEVWAAENFTRDTNVFRLSERAGNPPGATQRSDDIYTTQLGVTASVPISQQRLEAAYTWIRTRYRYFKDLDFTG